MKKFVTGATYTIKRLKHMLFFYLKNNEIKVLLQSMELTRTCVHGCCHISVQILPRVTHGNLILQICQHVLTETA